ncbi:unnamed protein product [marine sediment metagenome]|uniref:Uncharacterized protein n=1 Tax=marine sediment metagenome TaxID=412755 RepID=X1MLD4_9ZZZZ
MKLGYIYSGKVIGNLAPGGTDPYTNAPSEHYFLADLGEGGDPITDIVCPLTIRVDDWLNWDDPTTPASDVYGLLVCVQVGVTPEGNSAVLRLEPNMQDGVTLVSGIQIAQNGPDRLSYFLDIAPPTADAWKYISASCTGENGWLKVRMGGVHDRYIMLYDTPGA